MKIRSSLTAPLVLTLALVVGACSSAPSIVIPSIGIPGLGGGPTLAPGQTAATGTECAAYPTFSITASPQPSMPVDTVLLGEFPTEVAGQPVTDVQAVPYLAFMCYFVGQSSVDQLDQTTSVLGLNISNMSFGNFTASVNEDSVTVTALRSPNQDAGQLLTNFGVFGAFAGITAGTSLSAANLGGKNVQVSTDSSTGDKTYFYAHGDTLFIIDSSNDADAAPVLSALP